jgi:hypothetical protein
LGRCYAAGLADGPSAKPWWLWSRAAGPTAAPRTRCGSG